MKFSNLAAVFAPTMMACPEGDEAGLRDVMAHMVLMDSLLKLSAGSWDKAQVTVDSIVRLQSASPIPERRGSAELLKSPRHSGEASTLDSDRSETGVEAIEMAASNSPFSEQAGSRAAHRIRSATITSSNQKDEVSVILDEAGGGDDQSFGFHGLDVEVGQGEGALYPGLEAFSIDAGEQATLTLGTSRRTKTRCDSLFPLLHPPPPRADTVRTPPLTLLLSS
jgi:hypothetical protein